MRFSRTCYDKSHRCPGWAGGGIHSAKVEHCDGGSIRTHGMLVYYENGRRVVAGGYPSQHKWRFGHCTNCDVITWPVITRWLDPGWWSWKLL